jgi:proliferating cell nuclear antigen PCNA
MNIVIDNIQKADAFASIFQHIKLFTDHINIMFEKDRLYIQAMDSSHISIFELNIPSEWFDVYEHTETESVTIGVSSSILFRILNARDKTQKINLVYTPDNSDKLYIHFTSENKAEFDKHFETALIELEVEIMGIPTIDYQAEFTIASANFANIINQLKMFGDTLDISCSEEKIMLCSKSQEQGKMFVEINIDDLSSFSINEGETANLSFALSSLHNICLYNKLCKEIEVKLSNDYPIKIVYILPGGLDTAIMTFYLAPRVGEEN